MQKIISVILVVCLLAALTTSASAVDIYSTTPEAEPLLKSPLLMSTYNGGISTAAVEPSDLDDYLLYGSYSAADYLASLNQYFWGTSYPNYSGYSLLSNLTDLLGNFLKSTGWYLRDDGTVTNVNYSNSIADLVRMGFRGLSVNVQSVTSAIQALDINNYSTILNSIYSSVDGLESGLTSANTAIGGVTTAVNNVVSGLSAVNTSVGLFKDSVLSLFAIPDGYPFLSRFGLESNTNAYKFTDIVRFGFLGLGNLLRGSSGQVYLDSFGNVSNLSSDQSLTSIFRLGLVGLRSYLNTQLALPSGYVTLDQNGKNLTIDKAWTLSDVLSIAFRGISANIKGNEYDNIYSSILNDNNNATTTVNSTGIGPLLNTQLSNIGENLGHLAYVFASDDEIKLKQDSEPIMQEVGSIYDDSDSKVKVNADGIGSVKNVVGAFGDFLDPDAGIDDVITIVTNPNSYSWLTQETLNDLDSVGVSTFSRGESWHYKLYDEFYQEYFPERE